MTITNLIAIGTKTYFLIKIKLFLWSVKKKKKSGKQTWNKKYKSTIPPMICVLSKATGRMLYEQSQWRFLGLSVWLKGTLMTVTPSN